jgi:hypothetical protein
MWKPAEAFYRKRIIYPPDQSKFEGNLMKAVIYTKSEALPALSSAQGLLSKRRRGRRLELAPNDNKKRRRYYGTNQEWQGSCCDMVTLP